MIGSFHALLPLRHEFRNVFNVWYIGGRLSARQVIRASEARAWRQTALRLAAMPFRRSCPTA